ncbi:MAG: DNA methylase [Christensenellaceae bacterium]|jgi:DNA polymerase V|nr:DNA methylase [Christensenellaceae bacterium]
MERSYIAIDLKSFYASVECIQRGLDPMTTNLVVADESRTEKTICLAVTPSLKSHGISGRARLFEVIQKVKEVNSQRKRNAPGGGFTGESYNNEELKASPDLSISYITAPPQMALYMDYSTQIYSVYLKYVAPEDIHVYSIDEVFIDATHYLHANKLSAHEFAKNIIRDVLNTTGITATAGIGTNMYLCKIAMDIMAKRVAPDKDGVRIAMLDEMSYRRELWDHQPLTDFWRVGRGYAKKLAQCGLFTMGDVARCSIGKPHEYYNEDLLYKLFGINAELLIDHAWGWEPCTMQDVKAYRPRTNSVSSGQVLHEPYDNTKARLIVHEMTDSTVLDLVEKGLVTNQMVLTIGYDIENLTNPEISKKYKGPVTTDHYGRKVPKHAHGTVNLGRQTSSSMLISAAVLDLFDRITDPNLLVRRVNVTANNLVDEHSIESNAAPEQLDLFTDYEDRQKEKEGLEAALAKEKKRQEAIIKLRNRYGKNAVIKGMNLQEGATTVSRNSQIGGHKA